MNKSRLCICLPSLFKKRSWSKEDKKQYQPSSEENRILEENIRNIKRRVEYVVKAEKMKKGLL